MNKALEHFKYVADYLNMSLAAQKLGLSQPALSRSLKLLEQEYGMPLFDRQARGVSLTDAGRILYTRVEKIELELAYAKQELAQLNANKITTISIGAGPAWTTYLPIALRSLTRERPDINISITSNSIDALLPLLSEGKLDLALGGDDKFSEKQYQQLAFLPLTQIDTNLIVHHSHPLAKIPKLDLMSLHLFPWVSVTKGGNTLKQLNLFFQRKNLRQVSFKMETDTIDYALDMLEHEHAIMCSTRQMFNRLPKGEFAVLTLAEPIWKHHAGVWYKPSSRHSPIINRLIELLANVVRSIDSQNN
ncbi:LysR family transcriptional regulator [Thaumasiovibrio sp. DFM-14]|uniref:LysR family transcriptional regulator n=1 Tax=Thaumasiovibrio sp. DFM-14 TaxID=3384792 RepID=UPI0039A0E739